MSFVHKPEPLARIQSALARLEEEMYSLQAAEVKNRIRLLVPESRLIQESLQGERGRAA
jgi:hypothetical protein